MLRKLFLKTLHHGVWNV